MKDAVYAKITIEVRINPKFPKLKPETKESQLDMLADELDYYFGNREMINPFLISKVKEVKINEIKSNTNS